MNTLIMNKPEINASRSKCQLPSVGIVTWYDWAAQEFALHAVYLSKLVAPLYWSHGKSFVHPLFGYNSTQS